MYEGTGEFILFLNDDVVLGENFFTDLLKPFIDKKVAMVGCNASQKQWGVNGAVMCVRRSVFEAIGGFDEDFFFMWEDNDICENIRYRGYQIAISEAKAQHKGRASVIVNDFFRKHYYAGEKYFHKKWDDKKRIIGAMVCGEEEGRYLERVIDDLFKRKLIDELVVVCDGSMDRTPEILRALKVLGYPITVYEHKFKWFGRAENLLRERAISYAVSKNPYGILVPDADELFDDDFDRKAIYDLLEKGICWDFAIAHMWNDENHVRIDGMYGLQKNARLFKYIKSESQAFYRKPIHCGSVPVYAYKQRKSCCYLFKHLGFLKKEDIVKKQKRYEKYDKNGIYEAINFYQDMAKEPKLVEFNKDYIISKWQKKITH